MGALTSKHKEFTFRVWEPQTFIEIDDTELFSYRIRTEHLKTKRSRILPIRYWMADRKRFSQESSVFSYPSILFPILACYILEYTLQESKKISYMISNIKGYKKILNKLADITIDTIKLFCAKQLTKTLISCLEIYDDLITSHKKINRSVLSSFDDELLTTNICLVTNPRTESPMFNAYLFKHSEKYCFISFSTFASNIEKTEIPLSNYILEASFKGHYDLSNTTVITSSFNNLSLPNIKNIISLTPIYLNKITKSFIKDRQPFTSFSLFHKPSTSFQTSYLSINPNQDNANLVLGLNSFDRFLLRKISQKYLERLFILRLLIKPIKTNSLVLLENTTTSIEHALSLLLQTIISI